MVYRRDTPPRSQGTLSTDRVSQRQTPNYATIASLTDLYAANVTSDAVVSVLKKKHLIPRTAADTPLPIQQLP